MGHAVLSRCLATVLLVAGGLKVYSDATALSARNWELALAMGEIAFAWWLIVGIWPVISWWIALSVFIGFLGFSLDRALMGETSCGCFGTWSVPPWYMVAFDTAAIVLLLCVPPPRSAGGRWFLRLFSIAILTSVTIGAVWFTNQRGVVGDDKSTLVISDNTIKGQPDTWVGQLFPLIPYCDIGSRLERGDWVVMLYHRDCPQCQEALPPFLARAYRDQGRSRPTNVALVEVPPFDQEIRASSSAPWAHGQLDPTFRWILGTPRFIHLQNGVVVDSTNSMTRFLAQFEEPNDVEIESGELFPNYRQVRRDLFLREIACGPLALIAVLHDLGLHLSPIDVESLLDEAGSKGIDMLRLKQLAEHRQLSALGVMVSPFELRRLNHHAIVHLNGIGFAAVLGFVPGGVRIVYPLRATGVIPDAVFDKAFGDDGFALLLSKSQLSAQELGFSLPTAERPQGPHLRLSRRVIPVGRVHRKNWEATITITNDGTERLSILKITPLCSCMAANVGKSELAPGESTELTAKGIEMLPGTFTSYVELTTNQPGSSIVKIPVRGYLEPPVAYEKAAVKFERVLLNQPVETEIGLDIAPTASFDRLVVRVLGDGPLSAQTRRVATGGSSLALNWRGANKPGWYRFRVEISDGAPAAASIAAFYLAINVVLDVNIFPPSVRVSRAESKTSWFRQIECSFNRTFDGEWTVSWSEPTLANRLRTTVTARPNGLAIKVEPRPDSLRTVDGKHELRLMGPDKSVHNVEFDFADPSK